MSNNGFGFAILGAIARLLRIGPFSNRSIARENELTDSIDVFHHHKLSDGDIRWHRHVTRLYRHPFPIAEAHPDEPDA